jgi:hypothetical protein
VQRPVQLLSIAVTHQSRVSRANKEREREERDAPRVKRALPDGVTVEQPREETLETESVATVGGGSVLALVGEPVAAIREGEGRVGDRDGAEGKGG